MSNSSSTSSPIITLLTDFGTQDYFVAAMKGVILSINPEVQIVDITLKRLNGKCEMTDVKFVFDFESHHHTTHGLWYSGLLRRRDEGRNPFDQSRSSNRRHHS